MIKKYTDAIINYTVDYMIIIDYKQNKNKKRDFRGPESHIFTA